MAHGLRVWDNAGNITLDTTDRVFNAIGFLDLSLNVFFGAPITGSIVDDRFYWGTPTYAVLSFPSYSGFTGAAARAEVEVSFSGNVLNWNIPNLGTINTYGPFQMVYGYF